jgi:hypothetical protein
MPRLERGDRFEEDVDALEVALHAEKEEVARVRPRHRRQELLLAQPVADHHRLAAGDADLAAISLGFVGADVDERIGQALERALDAKIDPAFQRMLVVVQRAAMERIEAGDRPSPAEPSRNQAAVDAAFRTMAVENIGGEPSDFREYAPSGDEIGQRNAPRHGKARRPEREIGGGLGDDIVLEASAGRGIANDPDLVSGFGLGSGKIDDVAENAANRRAHHVHDFQSQRLIH